MGRWVEEVEQVRQVSRRWMVAVLKNVMVDMWKMTWAMLTDVPKSREGRALFGGLERSISIEKALKLQFSAVKD